MHLPLLFFDLHFPGNLISYALVLNYLPNHFLPKQVSIKNNQYRIMKTQNYKGPLGQSLQYLWLSLHKLTNSISGLHPACSFTAPISKPAWGEVLRQCYSRTWHSERSQGGWTWLLNLESRAGLFKARLSQPRISENFDFIFVAFQLGSSSIYSFFPSVLSTSNPKLRKT